MTHVSFNTRSELLVSHGGTILNVQLPSHRAELNVRAGYHSWMRHSLALYQKTTEKSRLSLTITSLAIQSMDESCIASGGDDGSIVIWDLTHKFTHIILESIHTDEVMKHTFYE